MQKENLQENLTNVESLPLPKYRLNPYRETEKTFERPKGKKLTVPDQSLTVKEIMHRFTRGQRIPDQMVGYYDDDYDPLGLEGTNIETLDLSQKYELMRALQRQNRDNRTKLNKEENDKKISKLKEQIAKELSEQQQQNQHIDS